MKYIVGMHYDKYNTVSKLYKIIWEVVEIYPQMWYESTLKTQWKIKTMFWETFPKYSSFYVGKYL